MLILFSLKSRAICRRLQLFRKSIIFSRLEDRFRPTCHSGVDLKWHVGIGKRVEFALT
jgi:hypothetical protein